MKMAWCARTTSVCSPLPQGRSPVPDRSGSGRRRVLPGSRGRHHRAHSPLHPCSCSQHLQRHADEPQLSRPHTRAAQLAAPPDQVSVLPINRWDKEPAITVIFLCSKDLRRIHPLRPEEPQRVRTKDGASPVKLLPKDGLPRKEWAAWRLHGHDALLTGAAGARVRICCCRRRGC